MNKLEFFTIPKDNLKINMLHRDEEALAKIEESSEETENMQDVLDYYTDIYFPAPSETRPYTFSSMVLSLDGKMAYEDNPAGPLIAKNNYLNPDGGLGDFWVLNVLRASADGIIIGAKTLESEPGITCHVYEETLTKQREESLGKTHQPCGVVISLDGTDIPFDHHTFNVDPAEEYKMVIATSPDGYEEIKAKSELKHPVVGPFNSMDEVKEYDFGELYKNFDEFPVIITGEGANPDAEVMLYALRRWGLKKLCVESPTYCFHLINHGMLDEYFINYSSVYVGGKVTPGYGFPYGSENHPHAEILSLGMHGSEFIFTRQRLLYGVESDTDLSEFGYA